MLYAQVIVAKRTNVEDLTYAVPAAIVPYIRLGSLVTVPLRRSRVRGVVVGMRRTIPVQLRAKIRDILSIEKTSLSQEQVEVVHRLASYYGASVAEVAYHALSPKNLEERATSSLSSFTAKPLFLQAPWQFRKAAYVKMILDFKNPTLLLFSQKSYAEDWQRYFQEESSGKKLEVCVGTIGDAFFPLPPNSQIIVDQPYHIGGKSSRRPYMTTRTIARFRSDCEGHQLIIGSELIGFKELLSVQRSETKITTELSRVDNYLITGVAPKEIIHPSVIESVKQAIADKKRVLFFTASKSWAPTLYCRECQQTVLCQRCQRPVSLRSSTNVFCQYCSYSQIFTPRCQNCGKDTVVPLGYGVSQIAKLLRNVFPDTQIAELAGDNALTNQIDCVVATEKILSFPDAKFDEIVVLHTDKLLTGAILEGSWQLFANVIELQSRCRKLVVQTVFPDHPIWGKLTKEKFQKFFGIELRSRKKYRLPPYGSRVRLIGRGRYTQLSKEMEEVMTMLEKNNLNHGEAIIHEVSSYASIDVYSDRAFSLSGRRDLQKSMPPSWHIDVDL